MDDGEFLSLTLTDPVASSVSSDDDSPDKITIRPVEVRGAPRYQFALRRGRQESHENLNSTEALARIAGLLGHRFSRAHLATTIAEVAVRVQPNGRFRTKQSSRKRAPQKAAAHNRAKQYLIPEGTPCAFLHEIGVMTADGQVRAAKARKFRQINRFLELVDDVLRAFPDEDENGGEPLSVVDFGCGKSYLTFALHHLIREIRGRDVRIVGLDREPKVIEKCRAVAERLDCRDLTFQVGDIAEYQAAMTVDVVVSLHACDTATDDALAKAVGWNARAILASPCCQHDLFAKMQPQQLTPLTRHGILKERFAALATDSMRADLLEACNYRTQIVEFIDMEHTAKNLLIRAVRREGNNSNSKKRLAAYREMKSLFGVETTPLEDALGDRLK